jgi:hypothetical protein
LAELGDKIEFIPYLGYSIRHATTQTRWSTGEYSRRFGYYVKYPAELRSCNFYKTVILGSRDWTQILANELGFGIRLRIAIASTKDHLTQLIKKLSRVLKRMLKSGHLKHQIQENNS